MLDLLLLDPVNPHALIFQLQALTQTLRQLGDQDDYGLEAMTETLRTLNLSVLESEMHYESRLHMALKLVASLLREIGKQSRELSDKLSLRYFAHIDSVSQPTASA